jgi:hypothetical protein
VAISVAKFESNIGTINDECRLGDGGDDLPGLPDRAECRREIVPGVFRSEQVCKARGELLRTKGVSYVCAIRWPNIA